MRTVFNLADRLTLARRLDALAPETAPRWGRMDCPQMLAHLTDGVRMALGELPVSGRGPGALRLRPVRHALIYWLPLPKGAPTAPGTHRPPRDRLPGGTARSSSTCSNGWRHWKARANGRNIRRSAASTPATGVRWSTATSITTCASSALSKPGAGRQVGR